MRPWYGGSSTSSQGLRLHSSGIPNSVWTSAAARLLHPQHAGLVEDRSEDEGRADRGAVLALHPREVLSDGRAICGRCIDSSEEQ